MTSRKTALVLLAVMAMSALTAYAASSKADDGSDEARRAIEAANTQFSAAFARGDAKALAAMYTADAIVFPPDAEMVRGNGAIGEFWKAQHDGGVQSAVLTTTDVGRSGDVAYETGRVSLRIQAAGKEPTVALAKYVVVWQRQPDGAWKLHRDIWNGLPAKR